jgi:hypothetical protein
VVFIPLSAAGYRDPGKERSADGASLVCITTHLQTHLRVRRVEVSTGYRHYEVMCDDVCTRSRCVYSVNQGKGQQGHVVLIQGGLKNT